MGLGALVGFEQHGALALVVAQLQFHPPWGVAARLTRGSAPSGGFSAAPAPRRWHDGPRRGRTRSQFSPETHLFWEEFPPREKSGAPPCFLVQSNYYYQIRIIFKYMQAAQRAEASGQEFGAPDIKGKTPLNHKEKGV